MKKETKYCDKSMEELTKELLELQIRKKEETKEDEEIIKVDLRVEGTAKQLAELNRFLYFTYKYKIIKRYK